ncbi:MAG: glycosyltransferase family 4 protein [Planctomycetes bacterium]|nr:glycosyltransferase family 4 protein [Planctomycetota bacterium]
MKVLFLTDSLSDLDGVGRYSMRLIAAMEAQRPEMDVHVLLARKHRPTSKVVPSHWKIEVALPPDYYFYMSPLRYLVSRVKSTLKTFMAASGASLIHAIKDYPHNQIGSDAARLRRIPCVATAHGTYTIQPLLSPVHKKRAYRVYHKISHFISVSNYTRGRLLELMKGTGFDESKVTVVPNCVSAAAYSLPMPLEKQPWHDQKFTLAIGEVKERKGHHLWLEAWIRLAADFPDWRHYCVGRLSDDDYQHDLEQAVVDAGLQGRVFFLGNVSEEQKIDLLQRAEVFVHTPVTAADGGFEGFGIVYLEASASGTACLGTLDSGAEDAIVQGRTGLLVDQTVDAIEVGLRRLMGDDEERATFASQGLEHAKAETWEGNAKSVLALYDGLLGK